MWTKYAYFFIGMMAMYALAHLLDSVVRGESGRKIGRPFRTLWHKLTWDEYEDKPNTYPTVVVNILGLLISICLSCIILMGVSVAFKYWLRFMIG